MPNQNSFGHLRYWLEHPPLNKLAEVAQPYEDASRRISALSDDARAESSRHAALPARALRRVAAEFLQPTFSTSAATRPGTSAAARAKNSARAKGKGRVYLDFLKAIHREVSARGRRMMFWGDIILNHPELIRELPKDVIALNWGYEANHPFDREAAQFARSKIPFYVCPGTSTWMTLDRPPRQRVRQSARGRARPGKHGAIGYLNTDWGDGGHPQPLAVSYLPYLAGAALSWNAKTFDEKLLVPVLSRDIFRDPTQRMARAALALGLAHRKLNFHEPNATPLGTVIAAPPPEWRELFCRNGLKYYARIAEKAVRAALAEVEMQRAVIRARVQSIGREKFSRWNWIWRRGWRCSHAGSCSGNRRSLRARIARAQGSWQKAGFVN